MFIVTDDPEDFPHRRMMVGSGYEVANGAEEVAKREPSDKDMRIVSTKEARKLFGEFANRVDGVTVSFNSFPDTFILGIDPVLFLTYLSILTSINASF